MRVEVDRLICEANGVCEALAPEVFALDDDDELQVVQPVPDGHEQAAREAVERCPKAALRIVES